jgi:hypothetical protein
MTAVTVSLAVVGTAALLRIAVAIIMRKLTIEPADAGARSEGFRDVVRKLLDRRRDRLK